MKTPKKNRGFNGIRTRDLRDTGAEVTGSNPVEAQIFFQASYFQLLKGHLTPLCACATI